MRVNSAVTSFFSLQKIASSPKSHRVLISAMSGCATGEGQTHRSVVPDSVAALQVESAQLHCLPLQNSPIITRTVKHGPFENLLVIPTLMQRSPPIDTGEFTS